MYSKNISVQKWGNSLAVRIPAPVAQRMHLIPGTIIELSMQENMVVIKSVASKRISLDERIARFDSEKHGGEVLAYKSVGVEKF
ncbi:MAG: hypothetical protein A3F18_06555 [Legionellales bacterium RIFCSPHIGHO2_12_FULL_37_14]|nr:MAG: hypothetical protein A3F18_06555 [Legionellales bacterium RIFCSPHIGHO2_12_FULL_37_14]